MGTVESFQIDGLYLFFNSHDHRPPHFHVKKKGAWEIRVYILTCAEKSLDFNLKWQKKDKDKPTAKEKKEILLLVLKYREKLLTEWEAKVSVKENI